MHGFKSFARKTTIPLEESMNVIVGPNGSGKSNITDALCFVLGRLSIKSIRAAKAANLLFSGNKDYKGANEASVELILDNTDKKIAIDKDEISLKRTVRKTGQSVYRINGQTKTRQELLELLSQAGIDPNGFNIVLQGEIASMIKMSPEERRKVIEEVAGISIYEARKHKSLRELEKTDEKIKEISAVLRERNSYLKNLEKEKKEAMNFQRLEETIKKCKKTIIDRTLKDKNKEIWGLDKIIDNNQKEIAILRKKTEEKNINIEELQLKINTLNKRIQEATSNEQETLHRDIADLKAELAGHTVRQENFQNRIKEREIKIEEATKRQETLEKDINEIKNQSPDIKKKQIEQKSLQEKLNKLEQQRRRFYIVKSELSTLENQKTAKERYIIETQKEMDLIIQNIESTQKEIKIAKSIEDAEKLKIEYKNKAFDLKTKIEETTKAILSIEKENAVLEDSIKREGNLRDTIITLENCPVCKQDVGESYKETIQNNAQNTINQNKTKENNNQEHSEKLKEKIGILNDNLSLLNTQINEIEIDNLKLRNINEKTVQIKTIAKQRSIVKQEIELLEKKLNELSKTFESLKNIEESFNDARLRLQELNFADIDVDSEVGIKQRELSRINIEKQTSIRDIEESKEELKKINVLIEEKTKYLELKQVDEKKLYEKCEKLFSDRNEISDIQKVHETEIIGFRHMTQTYEERNNNNKINKAQITAQIESLDTEIKQYKDVQTLSIPISEVKERLQKSQFKISHIGNVNMRALEIFDKISEQVTLIANKVKTIEEEKEKVLKIISEIDHKKKKAFMTTLDAVNTFFTRNYSQLSRKGEVSLDLEDKKNPFEAGLNILVKVSRGKYFDVTSLSGGEKTMVSLALIFAIQEYKPYCFYIFDEIDAALDKHNSELLSALIQKYMTTGQYIIVTHNDTLISEASTLYGVSMQENMSKIISLKI